MQFGKIRFLAAELPARLLLVLVWLMLLFCGHGWAEASPRPNIVIFMADDMGFSDVGCFGGEIHTPRIDSLATNGLRFTRFYNTARCSPSRASLLTGLYSWQAGIGHLVEDWAEPGYTPALNRRCVTIAEVLRANGYRTFITGKWHVGGVTTNQLPCQRGFDHWFGRLINGTATLPDPGGYYANSFYLDNDVVSVPSGGYSENRYVDHALQFVGESLDQTNAPFFLYCPFTAPHYPVTDPPEGNAKYRNTYTNGWEYYRQARLARQKNMGIVQTNWMLSAPEHGYTWSNLTAAERDNCDLAMARHSAMVENIDSNVGRVVDFLKTRGAYTNTVIFFLSDNGASDEGGVSGMSDATHLSAAGANWANTPYRLYKMHTREGGISTPLVVHWPAAITNSGLRWQPGHLIDLMPTCLELAQAMYPSNFHGNPITPLEGRSLVPAFTETNVQPRVLFFEHEGNRAVRSNDWKLVANGRTGPWELYDLSTDGTEATNLAALYPELTGSLSNAWEAMSWRIRNSPSPDVNNSLKMRFWPTIQDAATGDGDGFAEPGETVGLGLRTIKQGQGVDTGLIATLTSQDPRVTILNSTSAYSDFSPGTATNMVPFHIQFAADTPANDTVLFGLTLTLDGVIQWSDSFALQVRSFVDVTGMVGDLDGSGPVAGAVVKGGMLATSDTDPFGRYHMLLEPGLYNLAVDGPAGYLPTQQVLYVTGPKDQALYMAWTNTGLGIRLDRPATSRVAIATNTTLLLKTTVHNGPFPGAGEFGTLWSTLSGPANAQFDAVDQADTPVSFPLPGTYLLQMVASAGQLQSTQTLEVIVGGGLSMVVEPATNSLNVWLKFDDQPGTSIAWDSAHTNHSPLLNMNAGVAWTNPGIRSGCITFDGSDDVVNLPNSPDSNTAINQTRTVCLWFYAENPGLGSRQVLFEDGGTTRGINFFLQNGSLVMGAWNNDSAQSAWAGTWITTSGIQAHRWYHAALTLNGRQTISPDALIAYLDGIEVGRGQGSQIWNRGSKNGLGAMFDASRFPDGNQNGDGYHFEGRLDDFRIYERVLSASEIAGLAGAGIGKQYLRVSAGPDIPQHTGLQVQLAPRVEAYGDGSTTPVITWQTLFSPPGATPGFSQPDTNGVPTLAKLPLPGNYGLRLVADTGDLATCDELNVSAFSSFSDWMATVAGLAPDQQSLEADPDADLAPNWLEYELGTPPDSARNPADRGPFNVRLAGEGIEIDFLLRRNAMARGITFGIQGGGTLDAQQWTDQTYELLAVEETEDYDFQRVRLRPSGTPGNPGDAAFFRLWFSR